MSANPQQILNEIRMSQPPETVEDVHERLNLIERLIASIDPSTEYEQAILEALLELNEMMGQVAPETTETVEGVSILELPGDTVSLLQQANVRLEEIVRGTVQTSGLPVGLTGKATTDIQNGETGIGLFDYSGGQYAAEVQADEAIDQFDNIRVKRSENNLVTPISAEREVGEIEAPKNRAQIYDTARNSGTDLLSEDVRPRTEGSSFRINVALDTTTRLDLRVIPDDDAINAFNVQFNQGGDLNAESLREFEFDVDPESQYNFRCPNNDVTVRQLRVQEVLVA